MAATTTEPSRHQLPSTARLVLLCLVRGKRPRAALLRLRGVRLSLQRHGTLLLRGPLVQAGVPSLNGRSYERAELEAETATYCERPQAHFGTFGHPSPRSTSFHATPRDVASHRVVASTLHWEGESLTGSLEVLPTAAGAELLLAYLLGETLGVSVRGWSLPADGAQRGFQLAAFDVVRRPAFPGCVLHVVV